MAKSRRSLTTAICAACLCYCVCELASSCILVVAAESSTATATAATANETASEDPAFASAKVWLVSFLAILIISLVGLLSVAVVPLVQTTYYNHFIQYLVALAVGSLTGDAMLHLLPHAIVKSAMEDAHAERCHDEKQTVYKGLVALGGVYFFFMAEKIVALVSEYRTEQKTIEERQQRHVNDDNTEREKQLRRVSQVFGAKSCDDIMAIGLGGKALRHIDNIKNQECSDSDDEDYCNRSTVSAGAVASGEEQPLRRLELPGQTLAKTQEEDEDSSTGKPSPKRRIKQQQQQQQQQQDGENTDGDVRLVVPSQAAAVNNDSGHGHGHGHGHEMPQSLASVAWMVIFGDGLHNFTDGLAIGAAFAQSITGGVSTSIAVFCHELPHELGDFAVLLKTGMKVKQALMYNILSSILAAVGMIIGICLGNVTSASYWIFAVTGGTFIYISLVDMLPELNLVNVKPGESRVAHFILQNAGIMTGVGVMFLIAMFEGEIKTLLGDGKHLKEIPAGGC